MALYRIV